MDLLLPSEFHAILHRGSALVAALALALPVQTGCRSGERTSSPSIRPKPTCLVLSIGGSEGIAAHIGAVKAIQERGLKIDCVSGNSAGAFVGAILAHQPKEPVVEGFKQIRKIYTQRTKQEAKELGIGAGLLIGSLVIITGGAALPAVAGGIVGGGLAANSIKKVTHKRFVDAMDSYFNRRNIKDLSMSFTTWDQVRDRNGFRLRAHTKGNLARAVGKSLKNPFIFEDLGVEDLRAIDPGLDRVSSTPLLDACEANPGHKFLVLNASGRDTFVEGVSCPFEILDLEPSEVFPESLFKMDESFELAVHKSYGTVQRFFRHSRYFGSEALRGRRVKD